MEKNHKLISGSGRGWNKNVLGGKKKKEKLISGGGRQLLGTK